MKNRPSIISIGLTRRLAARRVNSQNPGVESHESNLNSTGRPISDSAAPVSREVSDVEGGRFSALPEVGQTLFVPIHYENNYAYPLIVWLHGPHDDERQLKRIMPFISLRNYVGVSLPPPPWNSRRPGQTSRAVVPAAATRKARHAGETGRRFPLAADGRSNRAGRKPGAGGGGPRVEQEMNISPRRIFLAGIRLCGGTMAFRLALNLPHVFAGRGSVGRLVSDRLQSLGAIGQCPRPEVVAVDRPRKPALSARARLRKPAVALRRGHVDQLAAISLR